MFSRLSSILIVSVAIIIPLYMGSAFHSNGGAVSVLLQSIKVWVLHNLAPNMRAPQGGIQGWLAMRLMAKANPPSIRQGIRQLGLTSDDVFVELGAGHGWGLQEVAAGDQIPNRIVCVEISPAFRAKVEKVKNELSPDVARRVEIHGEDCKNMPYLEDESVHKIFGMNVVYFLDPLHVYLHEIRRVLKPGGTVTFGCKFAMLPKGTNEFINTNQDAIVDALRTAGFAVTVSAHDGLGPWTEIKGTK
jgi:SAM-dependent methyltransferase